MHVGHSHSEFNVLAWNAQNLGGSSNDLEAAVAETEAVFGDWDAICIQEVSAPKPPFPCPPLTQDVILGGHAFFACNIEKGRSVGTIIHKRWKKLLHDSSSWTTVADCAD